MKNYKKWLQRVNQIEYDELIQLSKNNVELEESFYQDLEFGTAGLRGKLGLGTNRMNFYTVGRATQGIANFIIKQGKEACNQGVAIAYDCRHFSKEFAYHTASIFAANGIKVYIYSSLRSTPQLSFTIRELKTISGVNITASHNPKEYNGYKVYWEDGAQVSGKISELMLEEINKLDYFNDVKKIEFDEGILNETIVLIDDTIDRKYLNMVKEQAINENDIDKKICIVYTPLNGAGAIPVSTILRERGFINIHLVEEQTNPDSNFTTVGYPNPEDTTVFAYSEKLGKKLSAELLIATDPDADRIAVEVLNGNGQYKALNGNQVGILLINYILEAMKKKDVLPKNGVMVKSIVTGEMGTVICTDYGVRMIESLTGFKNICGQIPKLQDDGYKYLFGYEESIGYAPCEKVRDKDGIATAMLLVEAAAYYKAKNKTLLQVLNELFEKYGFYQETQVSIILEGKEGSERIKRMMKQYRENYIKKFDENDVIEVIDYLEGYKEIPKSNVLRFKLSDESWFALRPSGTEPKIKIYIYSKAQNKESAMKKVSLIKTEILKKLDTIK